MVIDLKVLVENFNCEPIHVVLLGNPRGSSFFDFEKATLLFGNVIVD